MYLEYSYDGPEKRVKVLAVRDCVSILCAKTEFAAEQMHPQDTAGNKGNAQWSAHILWRILSEQ